MHLVRDFESETKMDFAPEPAKTTPMTDEERQELSRRLDSELDDFINGLERKRYTDGWSEDKWEEEMDKHPFFMKSVPEDGPMPPLVEGLAKLKFDPEENTAVELATKYKEDGNYQFKHKNYRMAIINYTEGLRVKCDDEFLVATLYQNRATAHFYLENFRSALIDSERALKITPTYYKASFRAAKSALQCTKFTLCIEHCQKILANKPKDKEAASILAKAKQKLVLQERDERKKKRLTIAQTADREQLVRTIKDRNVRVYEWIKNKEDLDMETEYYYLETETSKMAPEEMVHLDAGILHWPVLLFFPEYKVTDLIKACTETNSLISILKQVFPAPWDEEGKYNTGTVNVYYEGYNSKVYRVDPRKVIKDLLNEAFIQVKGGAVSFILFSRNSEAEKRFFKENKLSTTN